MQLNTILRPLISQNTEPGLEFDCINHYCGKKNHKNCVPMHYHSNRLANQVVVLWSLHEKSHHYPKLISNDLKVAISQTLPHSLRNLQVEVWVKFWVL